MLSENEIIIHKNQTEIIDFIESFNADNKGIKISFGSVGNVLELKELINEFEDKFNVKALDDFYLEENKTYPDYGWYRKFEKKRFNVYPPLH